MSDRDDTPLPRIPRREPQGHKGTFGTITIVGGYCAGVRRMIGAPALAGLGALRAGAGLVKLAMPGPIINEGIAACPSATGIALEVEADGSLVPHAASASIDAIVGACDALVIGPGLGEGAGVAAAVVRTIQQDDVPLILDADALNALAATPELHRDFRARAIATPHPGEYARLASALKLPTIDANEDRRVAGAAALAQKLGCIVVLKGAGTVVSDGQRAWVCGRGHPCMGTAGTGDVLSGVIAALAGQFSRDGMHERLALRGFGIPTGTAFSLYDVARLGVEAHARAGERWAKHHAADAGMLAHELADELPAALEELRAGA